MRKEKMDVWRIGRELWRNMMDSNITQDEKADEENYVKIQLKLLLRVDLVGATRK
jgi:hypothetical protein